MAVVVWNKSTLCLQALNQEAAESDVSLFTVPAHECVPGVPWYRSRCDDTVNQLQIDRTGPCRRGTMADEAPFQFLHNEVLQYIYKSAENGETVSCGASAQ